MRKIVKGSEPAELSLWKRSHPNGCYDDLKSVKKPIRQACLGEQYYLCAYCCNRINNITAHNEHIQPQAVLSNKETLDFHNIVASCENRKQCGKAHKDKIIPLTPLMDECETELKFYLSGEVKGITTRATDTIKILNLGNGALIHKRQQLIDTVIYQWDNPENLQLLDDESLEIIMEELSQPQDGKLDAFAPILQNILRQLLIK